MSEFKEDTVTVSLRMPKALSQILDIQGKINGKTKTEILIGGALLLMSSPLLMRNTSLYSRDSLRNTCHLMQSILAQEAQNGTSETSEKNQESAANRVV